MLEKHQRITGMVREVLRCLQEQPEGLHHKASRRSLCEALLPGLCDVVLPQTLIEAVSPRQLRRQELVHRVRELAFEHSEQPLSVAELCICMHVTRRTLQNGFQEALGTSPATYLRTVRLNAVRRALREGDALATIGRHRRPLGFLAHGPLLAGLQGAVWREAFTDPSAGLRAQRDQELFKRLQF